MLCCGARKERAPDISIAAAASGQQRESDAPHASETDRSRQNGQDDLPWWKREVLPPAFAAQTFSEQRHFQVLEERANLRLEELERETRRRHAQVLVRVFAFPCISLAPLASLCCMRR